MSPRYLLDTHILARWLTTPRKLTKEQTRVMRESVRHRQDVALSAITLMEIAVVFRQRSNRESLLASELLASISSDPMFRILPLSIEIASEMIAMGDSLRDQADRAIVATARVERLRLITSDRRIIDSNLVSVVA